MSAFSFKKPKLKKYPVRLIIEPLDVEIEAESVAAAKERAYEWDGVDPAEFKIKRVIVGKGEPI